MSGPILEEDFDPTTTATTTVAPADTREAPGFLEQLAPSLRVAADEEKLIQTSRLGEEYVAIARALEERGVPRAKLYRTDATPGAVAAAGMGSAPQTVSTIDRDAVWRYVAAERAKDPKAFSELQGDRASHERWVLRRGEGRTRDQQLLARGEGASSVAANILGGAVAGFADPINVATLPIGGFGKSIAMKLLTEGLVQAGVEAAQTPDMIDAREELGEDTSASDVALNVAGAFVAGSAFRGAVEIAPKVGTAIADRATGTTAQERALARAFADAVPDNLRTAEQQAALDILLREAEVEDINPFPRTYEAIDAHKARLADAIAAIEEGRVASPASPKPRDLGVRVTGEAAAPAVAGGRPDFAQVKAAIRGPESGGRDDVTNAMGSSAAGRYQFVKGTFKGLYRKEFGASDAQAETAWNNRRFEVAIQERLMDRLLAENAAALERAGVTADKGNLYVAHFAGAGRAAQLAKADPNAPVSRFFSETEIRQNPSYLGGGKTVGEALAIIRGKVGDGPVGRGAGRSIEIDPDQPLVRPDALDAERPVVTTTAGQRVAIEQFRAADIGVDAELMQFKSGGDQFGVTDRLQGVQEWDPIAAGTVTVWEAADGRRLIADGHQRLGLARRVEAAGGGEVQLNAFVLRESDGFTARDARIITALKNIGEGTGTAADAAKVVRDAGPEFADAIARRLPPRSALVRDGKALARLDDEAFGAVINEVIPEGYGAAIGELVPDRAQHMAIVRVLAETDPPNRRQAEAIIRQAREAGFSTETQDELFGSFDLVSSLFAQRAKALDRALTELRKMKGAFGVAARNAEALDTAGNRIDVAGSEAAAADNARALALVEKLALRKGNAINALIDQAARRLADGERIGTVVRDLVREIQQLDLNDLERGSDLGRADGDAIGRGDGPGGNGRAGEPALEDRVREADSELTPDEIDPVDLDGAEEAGLFGPPDADAPLLRAFDDPAGEGAKLTAESDWHDIRAGEARSGTLTDLGEVGDGERRLTFDLPDGTRAEIYMRIADDGTAELSIDPDTMFAGEGGAAVGANRFGPGVVRDALAQLRQMFPEIKRVEGERMTGAGAGRTQQLDLQTRRPPTSENPGAALGDWIAQDFDRARAAYEAIDDGELELTSEGGRVLNTDLARELSPEYRADRSRSSEVHEPASAFVKRLYAAKLAEPPPAGKAQQVLFTAGGTGAGKSTGLRVLDGENAGIIYDTNMNTLASAIDKIDQALEAGWRVRYVYTYRDPIEALVNGALPRAERMGRTVPLSAHVETHVGSREVAAALAERYAGDDRVMLQFVDNSRGKGNAAPVELENLPAVDQVGLYERAEQAVRAEFDRGAIGRETLRGTLDRGEGDLSPAARAGGESRGAADRGQSQQGGDGARLDRGAETDPAIAERQRRELELRAAAPMRGANATGEAQDGTMGSPLFDAADQPTFDLDDGLGPRTAAEIDAEIAAERAGIEEIRKCL